MTLIKTIKLAVYTAFFFLLFLNSCISGSKNGRLQDDICGVCGKPLEWVWVVSDGRRYHTDCFEEKVELHCTVCGKPIIGVYTKDSQGIYHEFCFKNTRLERCVICNKPIEGEHVVDLWGQSAHNEHQIGSKWEKISFCDSCGRILCANSKGGFRYADGRKICGVCKASAVTTHETAKPVMAELRNMLNGIGIQPIPSAIPISLVDKNTLIRESSGNDKENTRGFTKSVSRIQNGRIQSFQHRIFVLSGLPMTEFKGVLAHELIHVWLNENKVSMPLKETEGFCNLGIMVVNSKEKTDYAGVLQDQLEQNKDPVYGDGYRMMKEKLDVMGWPRLIEWVKKQTKKRP